MTTAPSYGESYFSSHNYGAVPYEHNAHWMTFFSFIAEQIDLRLHPCSVLDAGCAKGFLVECLRERGVEAFGIDVSSYALGEVQPEIQQFCRQASITDTLPQKYDLIVCMEVLEHLTSEDGRRAVANLCAHTNNILFSSTPDNFDDPTHQNVRPTEYWIELFAEHGFFRDTDFDADFICLHAIRFVRSSKPLIEIITCYEKSLFNTKQRLTEAKADQNKLRQEINELAQGANELRQENNKLHQGLNELRQENSKLCQEVNKVNQERKLFETAYSNTLKQIEEIYHSSSWKITAPFRWVASLAKFDPSRLSFFCRRQLIHLCIQWGYRFQGSPGNPLWLKQKIGHHLIGYGCRLIGGIPNLTLQTVSAQSIGTKGGTFLFRNIASLKGCRVCVFSHYDPDNVVDPYVLHYLAELKRAGFRIVFVSACSLSPTGEETAKLAACGVDIAIARDNIGYDFGSWACALAMEPSLYETAVLIIANDSVYGPLEPLHQLLDKMMEMESAFCGLTENEGITPHIQSYFMMFKTAAIRNPAFRQFWENIHELASKWDIIVRYEVGLTVFLRLAGIESRAVVPCGALPVNANPTHCYWSELIAEHNIPFVKRELLRDNPTRQDLSGCGELFSRYPFGSMVLKHIRAHLGRTASGVSVPPLHSK